MRQIPESFATTPIVYAVGRNYQIMVPVTKETVMWADVGGKRYYDDVNGILRSNCTTHRMIVPAGVLEKAGGYKVCYRIVYQRKPYRSDVSEIFEYTSAFYPVHTDQPRFFHISDAHNRVEEPVAAAKAFGKIDFLILNGDLPDHSGDIKNFTAIHRIAAEITDGEIPVVFSRGNHDMRGIYAENIVEHTPTDQGRSYYTFRLGSIWGIVLDCGEDKPDDHIEYSHTICCEDFRRRQTEFIKRIIVNANKEYQANDVKHKLVVLHDPFTEYSSENASQEDLKTYREWAELLREYINPHIMICGHKHQAYVTKIGDERDRLGQACTVVVGCAPGNQEPRHGLVIEDLYIGSGFEMNDDGIEVSFIGANGTLFKSHVV